MSMMKPYMIEYEVAIQRAKTRSAAARQVRNAHERDRMWKRLVGLCLGQQYMLQSVSSDSLRAAGGARQAEVTRIRA